MYVNEMSVDKMSAGEMSVDKMSAGEMSVDKMSAGEMTKHFLCHLNRLTGI
jgi:hypothetical protein